MIRLKRKTFLKVNFNVYEKLKNGIFCLNKPKDITSAQSLELLKKQLFFDHKSSSYKLNLGHGGTLDSSATGVLVVGIGEGCKKLTEFLHGNKRYLVSGKFGEATDTYNDQGKVIRQEKYCHITERSLLTSINAFKGRILQVPPIYCSLKVGGKRASDLASLGINIALSPRSVECYAIELMKFNLPYFTMEVSCSGGFYVRSLVHDLGIALDSCAHVTDICRIKQGPFALSDCISFDDICIETVITSVERLDIILQKKQHIYK